MSRIIFSPFEKSISTDGSKTVLQLAQDAKIPLQSTCGGKKKCGKCIVIINESDGSLSPPSDREKEVLGGKLEKGYRLACEVRLRYAAVVTMPVESRITDLVILTRHTKQTVSFRIDPDITQLLVEVPPFEGGYIRWGMRASSGAIERLKIDSKSLNVTWETIHHEKPIGLCGSGIISAVAELIRIGTL